MVVAWIDPVPHTIRSLPDHGLARWIRSISGNGRLAAYGWCEGERSLG